MVFPFRKYFLLFRLLTELYSVVTVNNLCDFQEKGNSQNYEKADKLPLTRCPYYG